MGFVLNGTFRRDSNNTRKKTYQIVLNVEKLKGANNDCKRNSLDLY